MPKKVNKKINIKPKLNNKTKNVLFNFVSKKNKINDLLIKEIDFKIFNKKVDLLRDSINIELNKFFKNKKTRHFLYNIKYYFKKYIVLNFLNLIKYLSNFKFKSTKKIIKNKIRLDKEYKHSFNLLKRVKYFLSPDQKGDWIPEFKRFVALTIAAVFVINVLFFSNKMTEDLSKVLATTAYAQDEIISGFNDMKTLNTDLAGNKFYLALNSFYNLNEELSFFTKTSFNFLGLFTNINTSDLESIVGSLDKISQSSIKFVDVIEKNKDKNFLFKTQKANDFLSIINKDVENINNKISRINTSLLPLEYKNKINDLKSKVLNIKQNSDKLLESTKLLRNVLGENDKKRYLLVFQNSNEIRATGGFMGSYALVDFKNGDLIKTEVPGGGIYDLQGGFYKNIKSPMPLSLLTNKWEIQDSNWFLDFSKSATKISEFFESSMNGSTVDGIISINSNSLSDLINLTGDISLEKYNVVLNKDNVVEEIQNIIKSNRLKTNKPKEIIVDLFAVISEKLFNIDNSDVLKSIELLDKTIKEKNILAYFKDVNNQNIIEKIGLSGNIVSNEENSDYLSIVYSNVGASKTSQIIERSVDQDIKILATGEVISYIKINNKYPIDTLLEDRNIDFIRIYVPYGSELLSSNGFSEDIKIKNSIDPHQINDKDLNPINIDKIKDLNTNTIIYNDEGKTIFGNFLYLDKGDNKTIELSYKLPFKVDYEKIKNNKDYSYKLYIQSQPGIKNVDFDINFKINNSTILEDKFYLNSDKSILLKNN